MSENNPSAPGQHGRRTEIIYRGAKVHEGSLLYRTFERLARLPETELAKVGSVVELFYGQDGQPDRLARMQERIERLERSVGAQADKGPKPPEPVAATEPSAEHPAPSAKKRSRKKSGRKNEASATGTSILEELGVEHETVEQRQARMAKMEKQERMKDQALKKQWEEKLKESEKTGTAPVKTKTAAKKPAESLEQSEQPEATKKKPRRRRKTVKKEPAETPTEA